VVRELPELQEAIASRYRTAGLPTTVDQIVLVGGAAAGLVLALRDVAPPGSRLLVESPTYPGALEIAAQHGTQLIGWPVLDGWDADSFAHLADRHRVRAAYATFDFHNPTGALAGPEERTRIVQLARERDIALIVDETLRDLAFAVDGAPAPTVGATLRLGSLSKSVWAGLRTGWIRAGDARTADRLRSQALAATLTPPPLEQLIAVELLPRLDAIAAHRRPAWERNLRAVERAVAEWPGAALHGAPRGGLSTWLRLPPSISSAVLARRLRARGVTLPPGGVFSPDGTLDAYLRMPLTCDGAQLDEALSLVGEALRSSQGELAHSS
jgi:DNA-binding transcriptional MocR family regulator